MEKELKSCTGVLLRADLTGHGHSSPFCQNGWDGRALLGQPSKGHPCRILILFPYCSTISLAPHIKKLETYFALLYFWTFAQCVIILSLLSFNISLWCPALMPASLWAGHNFRPNKDMRTYIKMPLIKWFTVWTATYMPEVCTHTKTHTRLLSSLGLSFTAVGC